MDEQRTITNSNIHALVFRECSQIVKNHLTTDQTTPQSITFLPNFGRRTLEKKKVGLWLDLGERFG
jgi:hypothetical protein